MAEATFERPKCGNCGAQLAPNPLSPTVKCGYCGTEYTTADKPRRKTTALADVADVSKKPGAKPGASRPPMSKGSFKEFLWIVIVLYVGIVALGWLISKVPLGGVSFLVLLAAAAGGVALGTLHGHAPAVFVGANRWVVQHRSTVSTYFVLLVCVGAAAIIFERNDKREAAEKMRKAEMERVAAEQEARSRAEEERARQAAMLAARLKKEAEDKAAQEKLESELFARYFGVLWKGKNLPRSMEMLHNRVAKESKLKKEAAKAIFDKRREAPMPDERPAPLEKLPVWAGKKQFEKKCGARPEALLDLVRTGTELALKKKPLGKGTVAFDPNSCTIPEPHRTKCWKSTCIFWITKDDGTAALNKWDYYFQKGELKKHETVFPLPLSQRGK